MGVLVTAEGFRPDDYDGPFTPFDALADAPAAGKLAVDFPNECNPAELVPWFDRLALVRVAFPAMTDGRGFSIARRLRALGYAGRLRAAGPIVADQIEAARGVGFDEVETAEGVAARQPEDLWTRRRGRSYQRRLFGG